MSEAACARSHQMDTWSNVALGLRRRLGQVEESV
jgi:hypothetical protein